MKNEIKENQIFYVNQISYVSLVMKHSFTLP